MYAAAAAGRSCMSFCTMASWGIPWLTWVDFHVHIKNVSRVFYMCNKVQNSSQPNITVEKKKCKKAPYIYAHVLWQASQFELSSWGCYGCFTGKRSLKVSVHHCRWSGAEEDSDRSQSQTKGESEGHFHGNLGHRVMEAHVELLRNGLQQHASESRRKETEMRNSIYLIYIVPNRNSSRLKD